ncbi:FUSC family protein [Nocardia sp. NPDC059240]|uniref:FUSC family protein n=1 Tax=Nocardia sp. NPDC059240 TaxID=3346786 RepID=UPI003687943F
MSQSDSADDLDRISAPPPRLTHRLFGVSGLGSRWASALRFAAAFAVPASIAQAVGQGSQALGIMFGAFLAMYGENRPYRVRWVELSALGALFLTWVGLGAGVARSTQESTAALLVMLVVVAAVATFVGHSLMLTPPMGAFAVMLCDVGFSGVKSGAALATVLGWPAAGVAGSMVVSMSGWLWHPNKPQQDAVAAAIAAIDRSLERPAVADRQEATAALVAAWAALHDAGTVAIPEDPLVTALLAANRRFAGVVNPDFLPNDTAIPLSRPGPGYLLARTWSPHSRATITTARLVVAATLAAVLCTALPLDRPDWAILTVALVLGGAPARADGTIRALHRLAGTVLGIGVLGGLIRLSPSGFWVIVVLTVLLFLIDFLAAGNYALAAAFITPAALLVGVRGDLTGDLTPLLRDRLLETAIGAALAIAALWLIAPRAHRRGMLWMQGRVSAASAKLLALLRDTPPDNPRAMRLRRDLQYELAGAAVAITVAARTEPAWTRTHRDEYLRRERHGVALLIACWHTPPGHLLTGIDERMPDLP